MKIAIVVQRYGIEVAGGAELEARYVAERLTHHIDIEVFTTCATDYVTWRNERPAGTEVVNGVAVRRFPVARERELQLFARRQQQVFERHHSIADELAWLDAEGPNSPALLRHLGRVRDQFDLFLFFSYRYWHSYHGVRAVARKAVLVPTAERDPAIGLSIFGPIFRGVRGLIYNAPEERAIVRAIADPDVPDAVIGIGSDVPANPQPERFRRKFNVRGPFAIYVGRIDENKGCRELFTYFERYSRSSGSNLSLLLVGRAVLEIPDHPRIRHVGFLDDRDKFDAIAAAELLIMPSYYESLSIVALEAWALGRPVVANGRCDVLKGQCLRSNAGLYYESYDEFAETLRVLERNKWLAVTLGRSGRQFFRENYAWPVIERKHLELFERVAMQPAAKRLEPLPGWLERRRRHLPAAETLLADLPAGPVLAGRRP